MNKKKIELKKLSIESFQTSMEDKDKETIQGGYTTWICGFITGTIVASIAFGGCPTKGNGIFCEAGQTWACGNLDPDLPDMSLDGGGGADCHEFSDNCPRSVGGAGCIA